MTLDTRFGGGAVGSELPTRHLDAGTLSIAQPCGRPRFVVAGWWSRMGHCGSSDWRRGSLHIYRHHAHEQGITCAGSRSRHGRDAFLARALGEASRGENGA